MSEETPATLTLSEYVKAPPADAWADQCEREATAIVGRLIGAKTGVPAEVRGRAILEVGAELYFRRDALAGNAQLGDDGTAQPRRVRNPERIATDVLGSFLNPGIY